MDWNQGYAASWRLYSVNQSTWGDADEVSYLVSASITRDCDSSLIEDATISVDQDVCDGYLRLVLEASNETGPARSVIGTFLVTSPKKSIKGEQITTELECYSVLKPASDKLLTRGWYFPKGGDPIAGACELLEDVLKCPVDPVESDIATSEAIVAEDGETILSMVEYLLEDTDYVIDISEYGRVTIKKKPTISQINFDTWSNDVIMPEITDESDIFDIPNVLRVSDGNGNYETIRNTDDESSTSINAIGWEKWADEQISLNDEETLLSKGAERLEELSKIVRKISYTREYNPSVRLNDLVTYYLARQNIIGVFRITSQSISIGNGATVDEIAELESYTWKA